jgi:endoglucanase
MTSRRIDFSRSSALAGLAAAALVASIATGVAAEASAATSPHAAVTQHGGARRAGSANPLAKHPWGVYNDPNSSDYQAYEHTSRTNRALLNKIVLRPRMRWFGAFNAYNSLYKNVRRYIRLTQKGNPNALVQMVVFRMVPWESGACTGLPNAAAQTSYRKWINRFATAVGNTPAAIVLQPDLPLALCSPHHSMVPLKLVSYAAKRFSSLRNTTTYIDAGASDWETVANASWLLRNAGVRYTRGFALNATHSESTQHELLFGNQVRRALAAKGYRNKHFVINTASNGRPFSHTYYRRHYRAKYGNQAPACQTLSQRRCITLGFPPTTDVANRRWGLTAAERSIAANYCDGYMWIGRAWVDHNVFNMQRALDVARTTPW